jgi:cell division septum initiation protein DivIVA
MSDRIKSAIDRLRNELALHRGITPDQQFEFDLELVLDAASRAASAPAMDTSWLTNKVKELEAQVSQFAKSILEIDAARIAALSASGSAPASPASTPSQSVAKRLKRQGAQPDGVEERTEKP